MPPAAFHSPDVEKAVSYLCDSYNPELGLVYESPDALSMMVGAYYYGWWGKGDHWGEGYTDYPDLGEYNCRDEAVINQHINRAEQAGIDFFAMSWWGQDSWTDVTLKDFYLSAEKSSQIKFCIHYESIGCLGEGIDFNSEYSPGKTKGEKFLEDMNYIADTYFNDPQYLKIDGRPVVIFYVVRGWQNADGWFEQFKQNMADKGCNPFCIADVVWWGPVGKAPWHFYRMFDGITGYNLVMEGKEVDYLDNVKAKYEEWKQFADTYGLALIPGVQPGFDNRDSGYVRLDRENGEFYKTYWSIAKDLISDYQNPMVLITSFNEWHEGTEIEPSIEYGEKYLEITKTQNRTYWLVSDNLLAMHALEKYCPDIANQIKSKVIELAEEYNLPTDDEGLPISYCHEALFGEIIPLPFRTSTNYLLEGHIITEARDGETMSDWEQYADLLCYATLSKHNEGKKEEALMYFEIAKGMWDGKGLADGAFSTHYETYKLGLLLYTSKVLECPLEFEEELLNRLWLQQAENGGFITGYLPNGAPIGNTNSETTAIVLISLESLE